LVKDNLIFLYVTSKFCHGRKILENDNLEVIVI